MNIQSTLIAKATTVIGAVVLVLAIFITTINVFYGENPSDLFNVKQDAFDSDPFCDPCPNNSNFYHIGVLRGSQSNISSYMFVNLSDFPSNSCCNVIAKPKVYLTDIRGSYS